MVVHILQKEVFPVTVGQAAKVLNGGVPCFGKRLLHERGNKKRDKAIMSCSCSAIFHLLAPELVLLVRKGLVRVSG